MKVLTAAILLLFVSSYVVADEEFYERKEVVRSHRTTADAPVAIKQERVYVPFYELAPLRRIYVPVLRPYIPSPAEVIIPLRNSGSRFKYTEINRGLFGRPRSILEIEGN